MKIYNEVLALLRLRKEKVEISLTKLSSFIAINFNDIIEMSLNDIAARVAYHCKHEKRTDRIKFAQNLKLS